MKKLSQYIFIITVCVITMVGCASKSSSNKFGENSLDESSITVNTQDIFGFATADKVSNVGSNSVNGAIQAQSSEDTIMRLFTINKSDNLEEVQGRYKLKKVESVSAGWLIEFL